MKTRRDFLKILAAGGTIAALPNVLREGRAAFDPDLILRLTAAPDWASVWRGPRTRVLRFHARVVQGRSDAVRESSSYLGPVLELKRGERVRVQFENRLSEPSIVHWHGMLVPENADGHPRFAVDGGERYVYDFTVRNPAGTYLYHPHPHGATGKQVYFGLAGLVIVREPAEQTVGLPGEQNELNLVIQDRRVGADNQLQFRRMMMDDMSGVLGDRVLVNGKPDAAFRVAPQPYRLRLANASNARIYKLAWSDGHPMHVIAGDNGLFSRAEGVQVRPYVVLAPFERVEVYEDFGSRRSGGEVALISRVFSDNSMMGGMMGGGTMDRRIGGEMKEGLIDRIFATIREGGGTTEGMMGRMMDGMMGGRSGGGMMGGRSSGGMMGGGMGDMMRGMMSGGQGEEFLVARFTVSAGQRSRANPLRLPEPAPSVREGKTELYTRLAFRHMRGSLNGRTFKMHSVADDERLPLNEGAVWTFSNEAGGMMAMPHPMHIHGVRFRVLERTRGKAPEDLRDGLLDIGFKDTFLVFPGEQVRVLVAPSEPGLFMYHCHNLEHEDGGMMRNCLFG